MEANTDIQTYIESVDGEPQLIDWPQDESGLPWFDRRDAADTLAGWKRSGKVSDGQHKLLEK